MSEMMLAIVLCISTMTCASPSSDREGPGPRQPDNGARVVTAAPATAEITLNEETRRTLTRHLADGSLTVARLVIRGVRASEAHAQALKGVRIFIEKPDATAATPVDDPHYAGNFVLGFEPSGSHLVNVAPALTKLWNAGTLTRDILERRTSLRVTFVTEPWDVAASLPSNFSLTIQGLDLEVPRKP